MNLKKLTLDFLNSNMYILEEDKHILIIDVIDSDDALQLCRHASFVTVLLTHEHFDHICGLNRLRDSCSPCLVIASEACSERIQGAKENLSDYANVLAELSGKQIPASWEPFSCEAANITFNKNYVFHWMSHSVELLHTPGHSAGSACILVDDMLFVGDSVLESKLMVRFPGSSKKQYRDVTVPLLEQMLIKAKLVYPGHGEAMTPEMAQKIIRSS